MISDEGEGSKPADPVPGAENKLSGMRGEIVTQADLLHRVNEICLRVRERVKEGSPGRKVKKAEKEIVKVVTALVKVEDGMESKSPGTAKALAKAGRCVDLPQEAGLGKIARGLKKARKSLGGVI